MRSGNVTFNFSVQYNLKNNLSYLFKTDVCSKLQESFMKIQRKVLASSPRQPLSGQGVLRIPGLKIHGKKVKKNELEVNVEVGILEAYLAEERRCAKN